MAVSAIRGLLGFFGTSSKLSPIDGSRQHDVAVCVRERELGQMIALDRAPVAVGCCFHGGYRFYEGDREAFLTQMPPLLPLALIEHPQRWIDPRPTEQGLSRPS